MKRRDGFANQVLILIPPEIYRKADPVTRQLYITDIGYFPRAEDHYVVREAGCPSNILIVCTGGSGWYETDKSVRREVKAGEAFIVEKNAPHAYGSADGGWWELYWVHFDGALAGDMRRYLAGKTRPGEYHGAARGEDLGAVRGEPFPLPMGEESRHLFSLICASLAEGISPLNYELACGRLWSLFSSLSLDRKRGADVSRGVIDECLNLMEERIGGTLTLREQSERVSLTPQYLCRLFKQQTGHPPMEHYTRLKIQRACSLLDMTSERICEISLQLGIEDPYYFSRTFKRIMGMPPREYRRRQR
ncbi:MAG: AraC family transcriptional regulator [Sediminispirochaetaceae bacterium]